MELLLRLHLEFLSVKIEKLGLVLGLGLPVWVILLKMVLLVLPDPVMLVRKVVELEMNCCEARGEKLVRSEAGMIELVSLVCRFPTGVLTRSGHCLVHIRHDSGWDCDGNIAMGDIRLQDFREDREPIKVQLRVSDPLDSQSVSSAACLKRLNDSSFVTN